MPKQSISQKIIDQISGQLNIYAASETLVAILREQLILTTGGLYANKPPVLLILPLIVYQSLTRKYKLALPVTVSLIFLKAAADIFDDLEDADNPQTISSRWGRPVANNTATSFLILAERTLSHQTDLRSETKLNILQCVNHYYSLACLGQHLDLSTPPGHLITEDEYCHIIHLKSALVSECAVRAGSLLAGSSPGCLEYLTKFGYYLGMACQLNNDLKGILDGADLKARKITLPWIFALTQADSASHKVLMAYLNDISGISKTNSVKNILFSCGAVQYSLYKSEYYKQLALANLAKAQLPGRVVKRLSSIL
jgi:competence protein ComQ